MSSDNGIYIRKNLAGQYEVRYYCASIDYEDDEEMKILGVFDNIEDAIRFGLAEETEYGLSFNI